MSSQTWARTLSIWPSLFRAPFNPQSTQAGLINPQAAYRGGPRGEAWVTSQGAWTAGGPGVQLLAKQLRSWLSITRWSEEEPQVRCSLEPAGSSLRAWRATGLLETVVSSVKGRRPS